MSHLAFHPSRQIQQYDLLISAISFNYNDRSKGKEKIKNEKSAKQEEIEAKIFINEILLKYVTSLLRFRESCHHQ